MADMLLTIGLDCRLSGLRHAGIGRYILNLGQRLPALSPDVNWVYFIHDKQQADELFPNGQPANIRFVIAAVRHYSLSEQLELPNTFSQAKLDLLHVPHFNLPLMYQGKSIITIHDLLWHHNRGEAVTTLSGWKYWLKYLGYRLVVTQAVKTASKILVPAKTIKATLQNYYPASQDKTVVTLEGVDTRLQSQQLPSVTTYQKALTSKELVYVGSLYPHKNISVVLHALQLMPDHTLTIAGARSVFQDKVRLQVAELQLTKRVKFLGFVSDEELSSLYQNSLALIQPSLSEGFGLTGLEALASGGRVVASDIPIFQEIYQNGALLFDPHSPQALVTSLEKLKLTSPGVLKDAAAETLAQYSWDTMAEQTLNAYLSILSPDT